MLMHRPRIVGETRRAIEEREPPEEAGLAPHVWLTEDSRAMFDRTAASGRPFDLYLSMPGEKKIREHALKYAPRRLEVMGFMLGEVARWNGKEYSIARDVVTTELMSTSSKVRFDPEGLPQLFHGLDDSGFDYILVGWYHSHPGHTCFLSGTDLETQRTMFSQPFHIALVVDPINEEVKAFRLAGDGYEEVSFAMFDPSGYPPARPRSVRQRRLKAGHARDG